MANKGKSRHLKRLALPGSYTIKRKGIKWVSKPLPGKHALANGYPLGVLLRDVMGIAQTQKEVKKILHEKLIQIDGVVPTDLRSIIGLNDVIHLTAEKSYYRITMIKGKLVTVKIDSEAGKTKYCKITGKTFLKGGKLQLSLHDGRTCVINKKDDSYKLGDVLKIQFPKQKIEGVIKFEKGVKCYIAFGRHSGQVGSLEEVIEHAGSKESDARVKTSEGEVVTLKNYLFPIDDNYKI